MSERTVPVWADMIARSWRLDKPATAISCLLVLGQVAAPALTAVGLRLTVDAAQRGDRGPLLAAAAMAAFGLGMSWIGAYALLMLHTDLSDRVGYLQIDPEVQRLTAQVEGLDHLERPEYVDRLGMLVGKGQVLAEAGWGAVETVALAVQIVVTLVLLATVDPVLLALSAFAVPGALLGRRSAATLRRSVLAAAQSSRLEKHLHQTITRPASGKEIRVYGAAEAMMSMADDAWSQTTAIQLRARARSTVTAACGTFVFILGYAASLVYVVETVNRGEHSVADLMLVISLAGQLRTRFGQVMQKRTQVQAGLALAEPYQWLRAYARQARAKSTTPRPAPLSLKTGIDLSRVEFAYPGTGKHVLGPVNVHIPAGSMVALVGEYGSGKTTLVKLLCKFYEPTAGGITVDGVPLGELATESWRGAATAAFQDFGRYQVAMRHAVGFGDLSAAHDDERLLAALREAGAEGLPRQLPRGLDTQLGRLGEDGRELSEGQWQKTALARSCMRRAPLLVVLDEPTASLDPPSEHAIFQRHARLARELGARHGTVTVVVSHRFSTVRMADLILVLADGRVVEQGGHDELMGREGTYARLYRMQEAAYQTS